MSRFPARILAALLAAGLPSTARADWIRVETPSFIVYGDAAESRIRDIASEFERFREALAKVLPAAIARTPSPTTVVVFGTRRAYDPYLPSFNGKRIEVSGYFYSTEDENVITLALDNRAQALRTTLHEYAHIIMSNVARDMPVWANEGLAEYYSTFSVASNGREAALGELLPSHLTVLREQKLLTLPELLAVTLESPLYNEGNRRSVFYAQSWALVHMLLSGTPDRSADLLKYIRAASTGMAPERAWREAFGEFDPIEALRKYLSRNTLRARLYRFGEGVARADGIAVRVPAAEAEAVLADIVRHTEGPEAAAARLQKALALEPTSPLVWAVLGLVRLEQQRDDEARMHLMAASVQQSDWFVQYRVAAGLRRLIAVEEGSAAPEVVAAARRALEIVGRARPALTHVLAIGADIDAATRTNLEGGLAAIRRARAASPGRESYAFTEAQIGIELGRFPAARAILEPMTSAAYRSDIRDQAALLLRNVARLEQVAAASRARSSDTLAATSDQPPLPDYRTVKPGEMRTEGLLERIECVRNGVFLHVRAGTRALKFEVRRLEDVEFVTFRENQVGTIVCGPRTPPEPVYLTWRPVLAPPGSAKTSDGEAVVVEFIPK